MLCVVYSLTFKSCCIFVGDVCAVTSLFIVFLLNPVKCNVEDISSVVELNADGIQTAFD